MSLELARLRSDARPGRGGVSADGILKAILVLLVAAFVVLTCMGGVARAEEATNLNARAALTDVADPSTANGNILGNENDGGRYIGRVWTDKSVFTNADAAGFTEILGESNAVDKDKYQTTDGEFLTVFSALGSSQNVDGQIQIPLDVVLVIDRSTSMNGSRLTSTIEAVNGSIGYIMDSNPHSRVGLVIFSSGNPSASTVLELGRYKPRLNSNTTYIQMSGNSNNSFILGVTDQNSGKEINGNYSTTGATNIQAGVYQGMNLLANASDTTVTIGNQQINRIPVMIFLSDGSPNRAINNAVGTLGNRGAYINWWDINSNLINSTSGQYSKHGSYSGYGLLAMMTAAYMKNIVNNHYGVTDNLYQTKIYTIGAGLNDITDNEERNLAETTLNPRAYLPEATGNTKAAQIKNCWNAYSTNGEARPDIGYWTSNNSTMNPRLNHPSENDIKNDDIYYNDGYYSVDDSSMGEVFKQIITDLTSTAFIPTQDTTTGGGTATATGISYTDPIGQFMEVKDVKSITLFGVEYPVTFDKNSGQCVIQSATIENPAYGISFDVSDIKIEVTSAENGSQTLTIGIPSGIVPVLREHVRLATDGSVESYELREQNPLRVIYTVGISDDIKTDTSGDGIKDSVDLLKVNSKDPTYISKNIDADGNVLFYTNAYSGGDGDARVTFTPSVLNRYYYFQKNRVIFQDATGLDGDGQGFISAGAGVSNPVTSTSQIDSTRDYYLVIDYYRSTGGGKGELVECVVTRKGSDLIDLIQTKTDASTDHIATGTGNVDVVATTVGGHRPAYLGNFDNYKNPNETHTAELAYTADYIDAGNSGVLVHLGNNGRVSVPTSSLFISKKIDSQPGVVAPDRDFTFTVNLAGMGDIDGSVTTMDIDVQVYEWKASGQEDPDHGDYVLKTGEDVSKTIRFERQADGTFQGTFTLKAGEALRLKNLAPGSTYTVTEDTSTLTLNTNETTKQSSGFQFKSASGAGSTPVENTPYALTGTVVAYNEQTADFTNEYVSTVSMGDLQINKKLTGRAFQEGDSFSFTLAPSGNAPMPADTDGTPMKTLTVVYTPTADEIADTKDNGFVNLFSNHQITFDKPGEYVYILTEDTSNLPGITSDNGVYRLTVSVIAENGVLTPTLSKLEKGVVGNEGITYPENPDIDVTTPLAFTNSYDAQSTRITVHAQKTLVDKAMTDGEFDFVLEAAGSRPYSGTYNDDNPGWQSNDKQPMPGIVHDDETVEQKYGSFGSTQIVKNGSAGSIDFTPIIFTADDAGAHDGSIYPPDGQEFLYLIYEKQPTKNGLYDGEALDGAFTNGDGKWVYKGVTYDNTVYKRVIHVYTTNDSEGNRVVRADVTNEKRQPITVGQMGFTNTYNATGTLESVGASKVIDGRDFQEGDEFTFEVSSHRDDIPMPESTKVTINPTDGTLDTLWFGSIPYTQEDAARDNGDGSGKGRYYYYVKEISGTLGGVAYDAASYRITVQVTDDGEGNIQADVVEVAKADDSTGAYKKIDVPSDGWTATAVQDAVRFSNEYAPSPAHLASTTVNGTKYLEGKQLYAGEFSFEVYASDENGNKLTERPDGVGGG